MRGIVVDRTELEILEVVTYVIEALAEQATREASYALADLYQSLQDSSFEDEEYASLVLDSVARAQRPIPMPENWPRQAAVTLSGLSRQLWKRLLPADPVQ